jgi:hypothetical protein
MRQHTPANEATVRGGRPSKRHRAAGTILLIDIERPAPIE